MERRIPKIIDDGKGGFREETWREEKARIEKEQNEKYEKNITEIMKSGFTRNQAEYLYKLETRCMNKAGEYVPPPVF